LTDSEKEAIPCGYEKEPQYLNAGEAESCEPNEVILVVWITSKVMKAKIG
jgi:hypothetical protein